MQNFKVTTSGTNRKPACDFLCVSTRTPILSGTVFKISQITGQIFADDRAGVPVFNAFVQGELPKFRTTKFGAKKLETSLYRMPRPKMVEG